MPTQVIQSQPSTNPFSDFTQFWKNVKSITEPYWYPSTPGGRAFSDVIRSWGMLILLILLIIGLVSLNVVTNFLGSSVLVMLNYFFKSQNPCYIRILR